MRSVFSAFIGSLFIFLFSDMAIGSSSYNVIKSSVDCPQFQKVDILSDYTGSGERSALYVNGHFVGCVQSDVNLNLENLIFRCAL